MRSCANFLPLPEQTTRNLVVRGTHLFIFSPFYASELPHRSLRLKCWGWPGCVPPGTFPASQGCLCPWLPAPSLDHQQCCVSLTTCPHRASLSTREKSALLLKSPVIVSLIMTFLQRGYSFHSKALNINCTCKPLYAVWVNISTDHRDSGLAILGGYYSAYCKPWYYHQHEKFLKILLKRILFSPKGAIDIRMLQFRCLDTWLFLLLLVSAHNEWFREYPGSPK